MEKKAIFERVPYTDKLTWLNIRGRGIGGSDAGIILGFSNYMNNYELWRRKTFGIIGDEEQQNDNELIAYGNAAEDPLRKLFQAKFVDVLTVENKNEVLVRKDKPYLRASLDGEINVIKDFYFKSADGLTYLIKKGQKGIWENKTSFRPPKEKWDKKIPQQYFCQVLHYLNVTGWDFVILSVEITHVDNSSYIKHFYLGRNQYLLDMEYLEKQEDQFWKHVVDKEPLPLKIKF